MNPVHLIGESLRAASDATRLLAPQQATERKKLASDIQEVCRRCQSAYGAVLARLGRLKAVSQNRDALPEALRGFSADRHTRDAFNLEGVPGDLSEILQRLERDIDRLKYPIDFWRIYRLKSAVDDHKDQARELADYYDDYARAMEALAGQIQMGLPEQEPQERQHYARHVIGSFEKELQDALMAVEAAEHEMLETAC
jgi:hypothetical protein